MSCPNWYIIELNRFRIEAWDDAEVQNADGTFAVHDLDRIDYDADCRRVPKDSFAWYRKVIASRELPEE